MNATFTVSTTTMTVFLFILAIGLTVYLWLNKQKFSSKTFTCLLIFCIILWVVYFAYSLYYQKVSTFGPHKGIFNKQNYAPSPTNFMIDKNLPCNGHGVKNSSGHCKCEPNWTGQNCELTKAWSVMCPGADGKECNGKGKCNVSGVCECGHGYKGNACEEKGDQSVFDETMVEIATVIDPSMRSWYMANAPTVKKVIENNCKHINSPRQLAQTIVDKWNLNFPALNNDIYGSINNACATTGDLTNLSFLATKAVKSRDGFDIVDLPYSPY
jgi:hypothetical protein